MTALLYSIETADGLVEYFDRQALAFVSIGGLGAPPQTFQVSRGYKQDGQTEIAVALQPRPLALELWAEHAQSRQAYWDLRTRLLNLFRPNRTGPMTLTARLPDDKRRSITVRALPGPIYPPEPDVNFWGLVETIPLVAFNPTWFDPDTIEFAGISTDTDSEQELALPADFPIWFGSSDSVVLATGNFTYTGTWETYPVITLTGPYDWVRIESTATEAYIILLIPIAAGETRTIVLTPGLQSIVDGAGVSKFGELSADSNLVDFAILPDPLAPGGIQAITITMPGLTVDSGATLSFNTRYYAI